LLNRDGESSSMKRGSGNGPREQCQGRSAAGWPRVPPRPARGRSNERAEAPVGARGSWPRMGRGAAGPGWSRSWPRNYSWPKWEPEVGPARGQSWSRPGGGARDGTEGAAWADLARAEAGRGSYTPTRSVCTACRTPLVRYWARPISAIFLLFLFYVYSFSFLFLFLFPVFCFIFSFSFFSQIRKTYRFKKCSILKTLKTLKLFKLKNVQT
jgi:hypothetical protein